MKKKMLCFCAAMLFIVATTVQASLTWNGAGDGMSLYQEANWVDSDTGVAPLAGAVDGNVEINNDVIINTGATAGGGNGAGPNLYLGTGSLTMNGGYLRFSSYGLRKDVSFPAVDWAPATLNDGATINAMYIVGIDLTINNGSLILRGGGNPINVTEINLTSTDASIVLTAETVAAFTTEHLSKITVNGAPAVIDQNLSVVSDGATGSIVTVIPEPATMALLSLGGLAMLKRRR
ncbi:MAG: PEP-CTERM sorting domain-containing protein [Phycisphaerae bacterium]|nr:PEP-CTERM sorting domain-containing protein [Phycisphaerae bacterium]